MRIPQMLEERIREILEANGVDQTVACVLAVRGYYFDTMGKPGANDRRIYDDAMFIVTPDGVVRFAANTDPNGYRKGRGFGSSKGMACLKKGIHRYGQGPHKGAPAFRQAEKVTVVRDGEHGDYEHLGWHSINIHAGGFNTTSSLGCQTLRRRPQWPKFKKELDAALDKHNNPMGKNDWGQTVRTFDYVLVEEADLREGKLKVSDRYLGAA